MKNKRSFLRNGESSYSKSDRNGKIEVNSQVKNPSWPEPAKPDGPILPARDFSLSSRKKKLFFGYKIHPLLTKLVRSEWMDRSLVLFSVFIDHDFIGSV